VFHIYKRMDKLINNVWTRYQFRRGDHTLRNILVERYMHLVKYQAATLSAKLPSHIPYDDLVSAGYIGLMQAVKAYDMGKNNQFEKFAYLRIRGAMIDWLRANDWIPRWVRYRDRNIKQAEQAFIAEVGRVPIDEELADWVGMEAVELDKIKAAAKGMRKISIENPAAGSSEIDNMEIKHCLRDNKAIPVDRGLERKDEFEAMTRGLSCRDRLIIKLRFYEGLTLREISMTVGIVETRITQILPQLLNQIKARITQTKGEQLCQN